jgi:hypothetical protein
MQMVMNCRLDRLLPYISLLSRIHEENLHMIKSILFNSKIGQSAGINIKFDIVLHESMVILGYRMRLTDEKPKNLLYLTLYEKKEELDEIGTKDVFFFEFFHNTLHE